MTDKEDLKNHYLETNINLLSHFLFGINYKLSANGNNYEYSSNTIDINNKLNEINDISKKIKEKKLNSLNTVEKKIKELNNISDKEEEDIKKFYNIIMHSR